MTAQKEQETADAEILSMWHKSCALMAEHEALLVAFDKAGGSGYYEEADPPYHQAAELIERILVTQARTPAGIAVKLRIAEQTDGWEKDTKEQPNWWVPRAGMSALHDLERLSGPFVPPTGDDAEVFKAYEAWKRLEKAAEKTDNKADWKTALDAERGFLESPARTLAGVLSKLRIGCLPETYELEHQAEDGTSIAPPAVLAALADLERLAGRAS